MNSGADTAPGNSASKPLKPLDVDGVTAAISGTIAWAVAFVVLLVFFRPYLTARDASWWIWVCVAGILIGLLMCSYLLRRRTVYRRHAESASGT